MSLTFKKSARQAAAEVLDRANRPLRVSEIAERALRERGVELHGATPVATIAAILATENAKPDGLFERTEPGHYRLRPTAREVAGPSRRRPWTAREDRQVLAHRTTDAELAARLHRSQQAIASRRHVLRQEQAA